MSKKSFFALVISGADKVISKLDIAPTAHQNLYDEFLSQYNNFVLFENHNKTPVDFLSNSKKILEN